MEWLIALPIVIAGLIIVRLQLRRHGAAPARDDYAALASMADASSGVSDSERTDGARRAARNAGESSAKYAELVVIGKPGTSDDVDTYRAGYELIVRELAVQLELQEIYQERGAIGMGEMDVSGRPVVSS